MNKLNLLKCSLFHLAFLHSPSGHSPNTDSEREREREREREIKPASDRHEPSCLEASVAHFNDKCKAERKTSKA